MWNNKKQKKLFSLYLPLYKHVVAICAHQTLFQTINKFMCLLHWNRYIAFMGRSQYVTSNPIENLMHWDIILTTPESEV